MKPVRRPGGRTTGLREVIGGRVDRSQVLEAFRLGERIADLRHNGASAYWRGYTDGVQDAMGPDIEPDGTGPDGTRPGEPLPPEELDDDWMDLARAIGVDRPHRCQPTGQRPRRRRV